MTELVTGPGARTAPGPTRRRVLVTGGVVAAAAALTAACGEPGESSRASSPASSAAGMRVATADVPVGGGLVLPDQQVVVTQPTAGTFRAFSAVCTHESCSVTQVSHGAIICPCHMGQFSAADGSVLGGPPPAPLAPVPVTVSGGTITLA
ncbi:MAG: Rieske (2Fe-2S) protein [Actinomycetales bacterium]|nr:Rieske (2Fe-2S) protein [Actinomycetales bacterium]